MAKPAAPPKRSQYERVTRHNSGAGIHDDDEGVVFGSEYRDHPIDDGRTPPEVSGGEDNEEEGDGGDDGDDGDVLRDPNFDGGGEGSGGAAIASGGSHHSGSDDAEYGSVEDDDEEEVGDEDEGVGEEEEEDENEYESFRDVRDRLNRMSGASTEREDDGSHDGGGGGIGDDDGTLHDVDVELDIPGGNVMNGSFRKYYRRKRCARFALMVSIAVVLLGGATAVFLFSRGRRNGGGGAGGSALVTEGMPTLPTPPDDLADICNPKSRHFRADHCRRDCTPSECCYLPSIHSLSCVTGNEDKCASYEDACSALDGVGMSVTIPGPPENLAAICSDANIDDNEDGRAQCRDACNAAICCEEPVEACVPSEPDVCDGYAGPCANLYKDLDAERYRHGSLFLPEPPAGLAFMCAPDAIAKADGYANCHKYCRMSECCSEPIEACRVLNPEMCDQYEGPCASLYGETIQEFRSSIVIPDAPTDLADTCSREAISTADGFKRCEDKCDYAKCCTLPMEQCRVVNPDACTDYEGPCSILYTTDENKYKGEVEVPEPPEGADIAELCGPASLSTVAGFTMCEDSCDRARCCDEKIEYCRVSNPEACEKYKACDPFLTLQFSGAVSAFDAGDQSALLALSEEVVKTCSYRSLSDPQGLSQCRHICNDRFCCFDKRKKRNCAKEYQCSVFAACQNLIDWDEDHSPP